MAPVGALFASVGSKSRRWGESAIRPPIDRGFWRDRKDKTHRLVRGYFKHLYILQRYIDGIPADHNPSRCRPPQKTLLHSGNRRVTPEQVARPLLRDRSARSSG
jgi:hypothetical protein